MGIIKKLNNLIKYIKNKKDKTTQDEQNATANHFSPQAIYQTYEIDTEETKDLVLDMLKPANTFISDIALNFGQDGCIYSDVQLNKFFKPFSFQTKMKLVDLWRDNQTSTIVFEFVEIDIHIIDLLPKSWQQWCGKNLISLISFWSSLLQKGHKSTCAHFYLQEQFLYVDFKPWMDDYFNQCDNAAAENEENHWLSKMFGKEGKLKGKRYLKNHVIFGAEITGEIPKMCIYLYRMPASLYKNEEVENDLALYKASFIGNWLEWVFAIVTSFLLVSFLVPFGMAYVRLVPFHLDNLFSLPFIFLYNTMIVLFPLVIFRIVLIPMRRLWDSRQGRIEILQAEVARDQVFMPLLREWIIVLQTTENLSIPISLLTRIRTFLVKIGTQKYWLFEKISLIEKRRRMYASIILFSYIGVCLIEIFFLTGLLPTPQFLVTRINRLLEWLLLSRQ